MRKFYIPFINKLVSIVFATLKIVCQFFNSINQGLDDDLNPIFDPIRKEYEVKVQLSSQSKNKKLMTIVC